VQISTSSIGLCIVIAVAVFSRGISASVGIYIFLNYSSTMPEYLYSIFLFLIMDTAIFYKFMLF